MQNSRNVQASRSAMKMALLGGVILTAIVGIAIFLIIYVNYHPLK